MKHLPLFDPKMVKVLTVRQPWAQLIITGKKTIENRTWKTDYRGPLYIHAAVNMHETPIDKIERRFEVTIDTEALATAAIIGRVDLVDIVTRSQSTWFDGPYGWVLANPKMIKPIALRGQLRLFEVPASLFHR